eukprot:CAMPEP_0202905594 /NCGR_PEP_ID=MMETSP1392-20130828/35082_1 /ASSEMBLY_ACC=CAM_ASM_000868 /TAXON_ID=225041 /ORGANISM="Chlamydomonas chlamydogama, Strain SAG 11-48b" /LENGTH=82 /DNA_ID=CAMNT_0049593759 /DNA_START=161 /DNA_END=409 /DNA_ORIENTATION=+
MAIKGLSSALLLVCGGVGASAVSNYLDLQGKVHQLHKDVSVQLNEIKGILQHRDQKLNALVANMEVIRGELEVIKNFITKNQ